MAKPLFEGCGVALVTPFSGAAIDLQTLDAMLEYQLQSGTDAIIACGTTGEPSTLTSRESEMIVKRTVEVVAGRVPVIVGTGGNNTSQVIAQAKRAKTLGADGQLCVTPYYNKTTQEGLIAHFRAIADQTELPIILYNVPKRTGLNMLPETLAALATHERIVGIKEASGDLTQVARMMALTGDDIAFYCGADEVAVPMLALGAVGQISVVANMLPVLVRAMTLEAMRGSARQAAKTQLALMPLIDALFSEVNPIPIKAALALMGVCRADVRLPLVPMSEKNKKNLENQMRKLGVIA